MGNNWGWKLIRYICITVLEISFFKFPTNYKAHHYAYNGCISFSKFHILMNIHKLVTVDIWHWTRGQGYHQQAMQPWLIGAGTTIRYVLAWDLISQKRIHSYHFTNATWLRDSHLMSFSKVLLDNIAGARRYCPSNFISQSKTILSFYVAAVNPF